MSDQSHESPRGAREPFALAIRLIEERGLVGKPSAAAGAATERSGEPDESREIRVTVLTSVGPVPVRFAYLAEEALMTVVAFVRDRVPLERMEDVDSLLASLNWGGFSAAYLSVDHDDGE